MIVEQSVNVALTLADRAYFMEKGEVRFSGPTPRPARAPATCCGRCSSKAPHAAVAQDMSLLACVEVGGSSSQTVVFSDDGTMVVLDGAHQPAGAALGSGRARARSTAHRVVAARTLDGSTSIRSRRSGLPRPALVVCNDAEAAALGEAALRSHGRDDILAFVGMGTGIGGAVVARRRDASPTNLFGHADAVRRQRCPCGDRGLPGDRRRRLGAAGRR